MSKFTLLFYRLIVLFSLKFGASCLCVSIRNCGVGVQYEAKMLL